MCHGEAPPPSASSLLCSSSFFGANGCIAEPRLGFSVPALNVPPAVLTELQNAYPLTALKKTAQQLTKEEKCSQLRGKVDITKQQLAKLSKRRLWLKSTLKWLKRWWRSKPSFRNWRWNWKKLVGSSCNLRPRPLRHLRKPFVDTPLPGSVRWLPLAVAVDAELLLPTEGEEKGPKRVRVGTTGEEAPSLQQVLAAQDTFSLQELESIIDSFRQRQSQLEEELVVSDQRDLEDALGWSGQPNVFLGDVSGGVAVPPLRRKLLQK